MSEIIVTLWPATSTVQQLTKLYELGVRIIRLNFAHYTTTSVVPILTLIRQVEQERGGTFQLMMDLEGPSIRTGMLDQPRFYHQGQVFQLRIDTIQDNTSLFCDYTGILEDVQIWGIVRIESGLFDCKVIEKRKDCLILKAWNDFEMTSRRHINLPGVHINTPTLTTEDKDNVLFAIKEGFAFISISFCRNEDDVRELRSLLSLHGWSQIHIISKIENQEGLTAREGIAEASDIVMVARWDLGTEIPLEELPQAQMDIIKTCQIKNTKVIVATQMMASMVDSPTPTRAEVSDVFRAVRQGADYVMLSEETAKGHYPIETVTMMQKIIEEASHQE